MEKTFDSPVWLVPKYTSHTIHDLLHIIGMLRMFIPKISDIPNILGIAANVWNIFLRLRFVSLDVHHYCTFM